MDTKNQIQADKELIEHLGGPTKVCELLHYDKARGGVQRVQNWLTRGIPSRVKIEHPGIFMSHAAAPARPSRSPPTVPT